MDGGCMEDGIFPVWDVAFYKWKQERNEGEVGRRMNNIGCC